MSLTQSFSKALQNNIERTYTYAHAKNAHQYDDGIDNYCPFGFFEKSINISPFDAFMALDGYAFKKTKNDLIRYGIPFTQEQERRAKVYADVTERMIQQRSDYVSFFVEDLENTGITLYKDPYVLTTKKTLSVAKQLNALPQKQFVYNAVYENELESQLKSSKEQFEALKKCLMNRVSCLIGGAGTGKSFVTASIIKQLVLNDKKVAILAPTHKAREALQEKLDTGIVRTIHSFVHKPDDCDVIVIDESGMLSTPLIHSL